MERKNTQLIKAFAKAMKKRRKAAGFSQEELAFRTGLSVSYISLLETENRQPTLTVLGAVAAQFDVTLSELAADIEASS